VLGNEALTPTIDSLREEGITFHRTYSQAASTIPSLYSLYTSLYPHQHGQYSNRRYTPMKEKGLPAMLAREGWKTAGFTGIYFLADPVARDFGTEDKIEPLPKLNDKLGLGPTRLGSPPWKGLFAQKFLKPLMYYLGLLKITRDAGKTVDKAITWLHDHRERPFSLWVHLFDAHMVYYAPRKWVRHYYKDNPKKGEKNIIQQFKEKGVWFVEESYSQVFEDICDLRYFPARYKAALSYIDEELGRLLAYLKTIRAYENTIVVITSDHGENLGERGIYCTHRKLFDETTRVPLVVKFPNSNYEGKEIDSLMEHVDLLPTILDYLDIPVPDGISGRSLMPLLAGEMLAPKLSFSEHEDGLQFAVRWKDWQYYWTDPEVTNPYSFQFETDLLLNTSGKREKVIKDEPQLRDWFKRELLERIIPARHQFLADKKEQDVRLRALGYL
jgi:arylsulfatase A-like enzyme